MITYFKAFAHALLWDQLAFLRWVRGFFGFMAGLMASVVPVLMPNEGWSVVSHWTFKEWLGRVAVAIAFAIPVMITSSKSTTPPAV